MSHLRIFFFSAALLLLPFEANAQTVTIKSGEHGTFSRIVLNSSSLGPWRLVRRGNTQILDFPSFKGQFNIEDVFRRIDRTRISDVSSKGSKLELQMACDCAIRVYKHTGNLLVIDVNDRPNLPVAQMENKIVHFGKVKKLSFTPSVFLVEKPIIEKLTPQQIPSTETSGLFSPLNLVSSENNPRTKAFPKALLQTLQGQLARDFGTASSLGFLRTSKPAQHALLNPTSNLPRAQTVTEFEKVDSDLELVPPTVPFLNGYKNSSQDRHNICKSTIDLDVAAWSDGRPLVEQLSTLSANLFNPLGKQNLEVTLKLARLYLHFGFGAEAKHILNSHVDLVNNWTELSFIADILEEKASNWPQFLPNKNDCNGPVTLWLSLSENGGRPFATSWKDEILYELSLLPVTLRRIIAPKISALFLNAKDVESAQAALRTITRIDGRLESSAALEAGTMFLEANNHKKALEVLETITPNSEAAVKALLKKTEIKLRENLNISDDDINLLGAYITEYNRSNLATELRFARIRSLSKLGRFTQAFSETNAMNTTEQVPMKHAIYSDLVSFASDTSFAQNTLERIEGEPISLEPSLSLAIADRLVSLGFVAEGSRQLSETDKTTDNDKFKEIEAKIAFAQNQTLKAINLLKGIETRNDDTLHSSGVPASQNILENSLLKIETQRQLDQISNREFIAPEQTNRNIHEITKLIDESSETRNILARILTSTEVEAQED